MLDLLTVKFLLSYSTRPLQMFGLIGVPMGLLGFLIAAYLSYERLFGHESIANRPLLLFAVLLIFAGIQLVTMGLLAEIMSRTYHESQDKPIYVIKEVRESSQVESLPHSLSVSWISSHRAAHGVAEPVGGGEGGRRRIECRAVLRRPRVGRPVEPARQSF